MHFDSEAQANMKTKTSVQMYALQLGYMLLSLDAHNSMDT